MTPSELLTISIDSPDPRRLRAGVIHSPAAIALESGKGFGDFGRYSVFAAAPRAVFQLRGSNWQLTGDWRGLHPPGHLTPFEAIRFLLRQTRMSSSSHLPFQGGWIGFVGYDVAPLLERLPRRHSPEGSVPDIFLGYCDTFAVYDRELDQAYVCASNGFHEATSAIERRAETLLDRIMSAPTVHDCAGALVAKPPQSEFNPDEYCAAVARILEYICAGDIFQANLSHRFSAELACQVDSIYARCAEHANAPFGALLRSDAWSIVSTSPERFFVLEPDGRVQTRPIKGTRPRGKDTLHDLWLREDLLASAKDRAELAMIVDLERNDLGRVCKYGSVRVTEHAAIESFANVHHLVSTVEGRLREGADFVDLLCAMFPGGSITGAPKIRAMQIIDELERCRRGVYTGAIGYVSDHGRADFNIAIRTIVVDGRRVHYHVGGGIVAESDPLLEYRETLYKGNRIRDILLGAVGQIANKGAANL